MHNSPGKVFVPGATSAVSCLSELLTLLMTNIGKRCSVVITQRVAELQPHLQKLPVYLCEWWWEGLGQWKAVHGD